MKKRILAMALALVLVVAASVAGTMAWLMDKSDPVTNTFTSSDVDITLEETTGESYKMVPGQDIDKDPVVKVLADSEACYLFVKIEETENFDTFMTYSVAAGWTALAGEDGVYYREVNDTDADQTFAVLDENTVYVKNSVTKGDMDDLNTANYPKLTFTAYAIQKAGMANEADAWAKISTP